jgi:uncharacterized protein YegJ (DUF2314 family)
MRSITARAVVVVLALGAAGSSCRKGPEPRIERKGEPDFIPTAEDDPEMDAALRKGRDTLPEFVKALTERPFGSRDFAIKKGFAAGKRQEFIWLTDVALQKGGFHAHVGNEPVWTESVKLGDSLLVKKEEVVDWMYIRHGELVGGYTVRVLLKREPPEKQREIEELFKVPR